MVIINYDRGEGQMQGGKMPSCPVRSKLQHAKETAILPFVQMFSEI